MRDDRYLDRSRYFLPSQGLDPVSCFRSVFSISSICFVSQVPFSDGRLSSTGKMAYTVRVPKAQKNGQVTQLRIDQSLTVAFISRRQAREGGRSSVIRILVH